MLFNPAKNVYIRSEKISKGGTTSIQVVSDVSSARRRKATVHAARGGPREAILANFSAVKGLRFLHFLSNYLLHQQFFGEV